MTPFERDHQKLRAWVVASAVVVGGSLVLGLGGAAISTLIGLFFSGAWHSVFSVVLGCLIGWVVGATTTRWLRRRESAKEQAAADDLCEFCHGTGWVKINPTGMTGSSGWPCTCGVVR